MNIELKGLINYLKKTNNSSYGKILKLAQDYNSAESEDKDLDKQQIFIDIDDLKSLVDKSFKAKPLEIGLVAIDDSK